MPRKGRKKALYKRKTDAKFHTPKKETSKLALAVTTAPASAPARLKAPPQPPPPPPPQVKETNQILKEPGLFFTLPNVESSLKGRLHVGSISYHTVIITQNVSRFAIIMDWYPKHSQLKSQMFHIFYTLLQHNKLR